MAPLAVPLTSTVSDAARVARTRGGYRPAPCGRAAWSGRAARSISRRSMRPAATGSATLPAARPPVRWRPWSPRARPRARTPNGPPPWPPRSAGRSPPGTRGRCSWSSAAPLESDPNASGGADDTWMIAGRPIPAEDVALHERDVGARSAPGP